MENNANNSSFPNTSYSGLSNCPADLQDEMGTTVVKTLAYCFVMVLSLVGNGLVLHIFYKNRTIRTTTNSFIVNMAASDLMFPIFVIPRHMAAVFENSFNVWRIHGFLGELLCKLVPFIGDVSNSVSILTLILISIDRYNAIVWPMSTRYRITPTRCTMLIASTWIISLALHAHYLYNFRLSVEKDQVLCIYNWAQDSLQKHRIYYFVLLLLLYIIPLVTITILYSSIIHELRSKKKFVSERDQPSHHRRQRRREDNRVIAMLVVIVSIFAICFAPTYITSLMNLYSLLPHCDLKAWLFSCFFLTLSTCFLNPYIYFIFIRRYRQCAMDLLIKICGSRLSSACSKIRGRKSLCCSRQLDSNGRDDYTRSNRANSSCKFRQTELITLGSELEPTLQFESGV